MPKELFEVTMFNAGTICNPSQTDIPAEAASNSLNLDPIAEDGKLKGIPINTKLEDSVGDDKNILLHNITDPTKHDLVYYKNSNNTVYKCEDLYSGSGTEASLGALTASADEVSMETMEGAIYLGQGSAAGENPQWIGRLDHGQWGASAPGTLVMEEDTLIPPNVINETTSACSDGTYIYAVNGGQVGTYDYNMDSLKYASGEVTKIRVSDGRIMARSTTALGPVNAVAVSWDGNDIWVIASEKWAVAKNVYEAAITAYATADNGDATTVTSAAHGLINGDIILISGTTNYEGYGTVAEATTNTFKISAPFVADDGTGTWRISNSTNAHIIYKLNVNDLKVNSVITTNLDTLVREAKSSTAANDYWAALDDTTADTGNQWQHEDSYWSGQDVYDYQGTFSDIIELDGTLWVCTSAGALFNSTSIDGTSITFSNRTPYGLGFYRKTDVFTEQYMAPGGDTNQTGGWYNSDASAWRLPECHNASLMQLTGSNDWVGMYVRNGEMSDAIQFDEGSGNQVVTGRSLIFSVNEAADSGLYIDGSSHVKISYLSDTGLVSSGGVREISNVMYKCPKDVYKSAYQVIKTWGTGGMEWNIAEFTNPAYTAAHGNDITVNLVEGDDTAQIPIRISDTVIVGLISDAYLGLGDQNSAADADARNKYRTMSKWTDSSGWSRADLGSVMYLSQRAAKIEQTDTTSGFHQANAGYFYKFSFVFDGFQESPLGAAMMIWSNGNKVKIPFTFSTDNFPLRVTAIRIYRATSISTADRDIGGFYHFVGEVDVTSQENINLSTDTTYTDGQDGVNEGDELQPAESRTFTFIDHGTAGATYETMSGLLEGMTDSNVKYSLSTQLNSSLFIAKCDHDSQDEASNIIYKSVAYKPSLINWALDFLKLPSVPTAIKAFNGRIYAFTESATYRIEPNSFFIEDTFEGAGCIGPDAIAVSDYGMCYADNHNVYLHTGQTPIPIGDSILTSDAGIGYLDLLSVSTYSPKIGFDSRRKCFTVFITNAAHAKGALVWSYNIVRKIWNLWEAQGTTNGICTGKKGEVLAAVSDGHLYDMYSSATRKSNWYWVSKRLSMRHKSQNKKWYEAIVSYEGTAPTIIVNWDYSDDAASIASGTSETNILRKQLHATRSSDKRRLIRVKITAGGADTEVDSLGLTFRRFAKLIDQGSA